MATIARADVSVHADTSPFLAEIAALKKRVEAEDWFIKVHPILDDKFKDDIQKQLSKIKGLEINVASDLPELQKSLAKLTQAQAKAQKDILSEENQLNTALAKEANARKAIISQQVAQQKQILDLEDKLNASIKKEADSRASTARAQNEATKTLLEAENKLNEAITKEANARAAAHREQLAAIKTQQAQADLEREGFKDHQAFNRTVITLQNARAAAARAAVAEAKQERIHLQEQLEVARALTAEHNAQTAEHRKHIQAIKAEHAEELEIARTLTAQHNERNAAHREIINAAKAENAEEKEIISLERQRLALANAVRRETERQEAILRRNRTIMALTVREWRFLAVKVLGVRRNLDVTLKAYLLNAAASESMLSSMIRLFKTSLNLRRSALQFGTAFATGFAASAQLIGASVIGLQNLVGLMHVAAGLGIIAVGVKFALKDAEVKAAADAAGKAFSDVMSNAVKENFNPALKQIFEDFQVSIKKLEPALKDFFKTVSPEVARLGKQFNDLIASEKFGQFIRDIGASTANFLSKINLDAIFDGFIKIRDALGESRKLIKEAFGPGIFSGLTVDGIVRGLQNLTASLVAAGPGIRAFKRAFGDALSGVGAALDGILHTIGDVGEALFNALGPIANQVARDIGQVIEALIRFASVVLPKVKDNLIEFSDVFSDNLETALEIFDEPFANTLNNILELGTKLAPLLPIFARIAAALEPIISAGIELGKILAPIAVSFFDTIADVLERIKPAIVFVEEKIKAVREFLERHPAIQTWLGRILAIVAIGVVSVLLLLAALKSIINLARGFIGLGKAILSPLESLKKLGTSLKNFGKKRLGIKVDVDDDDLDSLKKKLDSLLKNKNINIDVDVDDDDLNALKKKLDQFVNKEILIDVDLDLSDLRKLDNDLAKERILKIRCVKEGDCDCGDDDDDDDFDRKRKRRPKGPKGPKGGGGRRVPRVPPPPPIPRSTTDSYRDFGRAVEGTDKPIAKFDSNVKRKLLPSIGRAAGKSGIGALIALGGFTLFNTIPNDIQLLSDRLGGLPARFDAFKQKLSETDSIAGKFKLTIGFLGTEIGALVSGGFANFANGLNTAFKDLTGIDVKGIIGGIVNGFKTGDWSQAGAAVKSGLEGALSLIPGGETIQGIVDPIINGVVQGFQTGDWSAAGNAIVDGLKSNFPTITAIGGPIATGIADSIRTGDWSHALDGLKTAADNAISIIKEKFNSFKETISGIFSPEVIEGKAVPVGGAAPQKAAATTTIDPAIAEQANAIAAAIEGAQARIATAIAAIKTTVATGFAGLAFAAAPGLAAMGTAITTAFTGVKTTVTTFFATELPAAAAQGTTALGPVLATGLTAAVTQGFSTLGATMGGLMQAAFAVAAQGAVAGMNTIVQVITTGAQAIGVAFNLLPPLLGQIMTAAMQAATQAAVAGGQALVAAVMAVVGQLEALAGRFYNAGALLGQRFADGLRSKISEVQQAGADLAAAAAGNFNASPAKFGPLAGHGDAFYRGREFVLRLIRGLLDKKPELRAKAGELAEELARFRETERGKRIEKELRRIASNIRIEREIGRGGGGFGFGFGSGGAAGSQLSGRFSRTIGGRILGQDTQASIGGRNTGTLGQNLIQIRPGNIFVTLAGINDPKEFLNNLSKELMTNCVGR